MNTLTNVSNFRTSPDDAAVSRSDVPTGPALPVGPLAPEQIKEILESQRYEELTIEFDIHDRILWYFMSPVSRPSATVGLMQDIKRLQAVVRTIFDAHNNPADPLFYNVLDMCTNVFMETYTTTSTRTSCDPRRDVNPGQTRIIPPVRTASHPVR